MKPVYNWGITLSGGGVRGFAQLGALIALREHGIEPDIISGTSVGAIVGALYADGYTPEKIYEIFKTIRFSDLVAVNFEEGGFFKTTGIQSILEKYLRAKRFEELRIPLKIIASDIEEGKACCFAEGELIPAIIASCAVPIVFAPVSINGHYYVDGGMFDNFPVKCIRKECRKIIGVNVSPVVKMKYDKSIKYVIERSMNYMVGANTQESIKMCDYLITDEKLSYNSLFDTKNIEVMYKQGYLSAQSYLNDNKKELDKDIKRNSSRKWFRFFL